MSNFLHQEHLRDRWTSQSGLDIPETDRLHQLLWHAALWHYSCADATRWQVSSCHMLWCHLLLGWTFSISRFFALCGGRAILKNDWNEVVDLILKPRPGGKRDKPRTLLSVTWAQKVFQAWPPVSLQRRKNFWSAAERSGRRLRTQRQPWKSCPTSVVWRGSCCEACPCMAKRTSSLLLDWFVVSSRWY